MDLISTLRKEGSRGGRANFKWDDVKDDHHRENYLGHSLMAPVGRWQKSRDLSWYAKGDADADQTAAQRERAEEIRRIKEAEQDALSAALGFPVERRSVGTGANGISVKEVQKVVEETSGVVGGAGGEDELGEADGVVGRGVGFDRRRINAGQASTGRERGMPGGDMETAAAGLTGRADRKTIQGEEEERGKRTDDDRERRREKKRHRRRDQVHERASREERHGERRRNRSRSRSQSHGGTGRGDKTITTTGEHRERGHALDRNYKAQGTSVVIREMTTDEER
ncbi:MAG: hypothetical protein M1823_005313 [Watsoniomyces obsoletus]|nr:MAG: hypothetical protein M1823_005313 [Watsoniomyces obsoletus]